MAWQQITRMGKGAVTTAHAAGTADTATSSAITCEGYNAVIVKVDVAGSGAWTIKLQGMLESTGTYADLYDNSGTLMSTGSISASRGQLFVGIPDYIKVVATEDSGTATVTVKVQPIVV